MPERKSFLLRVDPALWAEIERLAQAELRSVNAQVEYLLRDALQRRGLSGRSREGAGRGGSGNRHADRPASGDVE